MVVEQRNEGKSLIKKISDFEKKTNYSIYLGTGLYQICVGLVLALLVSFLIGLPIIMAYPYLSPMLLWGLKIFGWLLIILGLITCLSPFIIEKSGEDRNKILTIILKISSIITLILIPIGIFLGIALRSELKGEEKSDSVTRLYFVLLFLTGLIHLLMGILLVYVLPPVLWDYFDLVYPFLNYEIMNFLMILGWICLIPGAVLLLCSFSAKKFSTIEDIKSQPIFIKILWVLILSASVFITMVFPIGTFLGLTIIQEFYSLKKRDGF